MVENVADSYYCMLVAELGSPMSPYPVLFRSRTRVLARAEALVQRVRRWTSLSFFSSNRNLGRRVFLSSLTLFKKIGDHLSRCRGQCFLLLDGRVKEGVRIFFKLGKVKHT